jgi:hypothetical protein
MEVRIGDRVEILKGKRQGVLGKITALQGDRVVVEIPGVNYETSFLKADVMVRQKASRINPLEEDGTVGCTPLEVSGEKKLRLMNYLVKNGKLCPSFPYQCTGECGIKND